MIKKDIVFESKKISAFTNKESIEYTRIIPANSTVEQAVELIARWVLEDCVKFYEAPTSDYLEVRVGNKVDDYDRKKMKFIQTVRELKTACYIYLTLGPCAFEDMVIYTYTNTNNDCSRNCYSFKSTSY